MPPQPPTVAALLAQASGALRAGRPDQALAPLREAAFREPARADIPHDLGLACLECGRLDEAITALQAAIAAEPGFADAHLRLGIALHSAGFPDAALAAYRRAAALLPSLADARYRAGELLEALGRTADAIQCFRRAAASAPRTVPGRIAEARALLAENRDAEAETRLRQALARDTRNAAALELLGHTLADAGRFIEARDCFVAAIESAPRRAGLYYDIVRCAKLTREDAPRIGRMREALAQPGLETLQRSRLHLALGKAAEDLGETAEAMRHFEQAEALRNQLCRFDAGAFAARIDRLIERFPAPLPRHQAPEPRRPAPILIIGLPRSGTTLLEQILSSHPQVGAGGELPFWNERGAAWEAAGAPQPSPEFLAAAATDYRRLLRTIAPRAARVTDKMPLNFQWAALIQQALPDATILHIRRDPVATARSIHRTHFNPLMAFPTGGDALTRYIRDSRRLVAHWQSVLPPEQFIELEYEALVAAPEPAIRRLLAACCLPWDPACLHPERNPRPVRTPSKWQVRAPIGRLS